MGDDGSEGPDYVRMTWTITIDEHLAEVRITGTEGTPESCTVKCECGVSATSADVAAGVALVRAKHRERKRKRTGAKP